MFNLMLRPAITTTLRSASFLAGVFTGGASKKMDQPRAIRSYRPANPDGPFPYTAADMEPMDPGQDTSFYSEPRFVTHIDDNAIHSVQTYYANVLPKKGNILDFCSSWISHYPPEIDDARKSGELVVVGTGMNKSELSQNSVLNGWTIQDLNEDPQIKLPREAAGQLDASTCVVSIDYLTKPVEVLESIRSQTNKGGAVHLVISNRCFPTKVVGRWLKVEESERLEMVGDYLWWSGWRDIEIETLVEATWMKDPLWVVRGKNIEG